MEIVGLIVVYLVSFYLTRKYHKKAYGKGGIWENTSPDLTSFVLTILPLLNTATFIVFYGLGSPIKQRQERRRNCINKFFGLKDRNNEN